MNQELWSWSFLFVCVSIFLRIFTRKTRKRRVAVTWPPLILRVSRTMTIYKGVAFDRLSLVPIFLGFLGNRVEMTVKNLRNFKKILPWTNPASNLNNRLEKALKMRRKKKSFTTFEFLHLLMYFLLVHSKILATSLRFSTASEYATAP